jgi:hypothetical protein
LLTLRADSIAFSGFNGRIRSAPSIPLPERHSRDVDDDYDVQDAALKAVFEGAAALYERGLVGDNRRLLQVRSKQRSVFKRILDGSIDEVIDGRAR